MTGRHTLISRFRRKTVDPVEQIPSEKRSFPRRRMPSSSEYQTTLLASLPNRLIFGTFFVAWVLLFHLLGNSTLGYVNTPSIFGWLYALYQHDSPAESGDELCPMIPFLVLALFYLKRKELTLVEKQPWALGLVFVLLGLLAHVIGFIVQQTRISVVGFLIGGFGLMGMVWGRAWLRAVCLPWFMLVAAIPISAYLDSATFGLRLLSSQISVAICRVVFGLKLIRQETQVSLPPSGESAGFHFEVAAACSGMRSLTAVLLISVLFAYLNYRTIWRRALIVASAVPLALMGNVIRLCTVFLVGDAFGEAAGRFIETKMGFITWIAALLGLFQVSRWIREPEGIGQVNSGVALPATVQNPSGFPSGSLRLDPIFPSAALGLMLAAVGLVSHIRNGQRVGEPGVKLENVPLISDSGRIARTNSVHLPLAIDGYTAETVAITDLEFNYLPPDTSFGRVAYRSYDRQFMATASVVLMGTDRTSIHRPEYCLTSQGWRILRQTVEVIRIPGSPQLEIEVQRFDTHIQGRDSGGRNVERGGVYVFWFTTEGQSTAHHFQRQWSMMKSLLFENVVQRWAYISFFSQCQPGREEDCYRRLVGLISAGGRGILRLTPPSPSAKGTSH